MRQGQGRCSFQFVRRFRLQCAHPLPVQIEDKHFIARRAGGVETPRLLVDKQIMEKPARGLPFRHRPFRNKFPVCIKNLDAFVARIGHIDPLVLFAHCDRGRLDELAIGLALVCPRWSRLRQWSRT